MLVRESKIIADLEKRMIFGRQKPQERDSESGVSKLHT